MKKLTLTIAAVVFGLCTLIVHPGTAQADQSAPIVLKILDVVIIRPVSVVVATGLTGACIASMPLAYVAGVGEESARILIEAPWRFTGARYLGDFTNYKDGEPITTLPGN